MDEFSDIWIEQCDAARDIRESWGTQKALGYLIGEKFLNYIRASDSRPDVDDPEEWRARADIGLAESEVVGEYYPILGSRSIKNLPVRLPCQMLFSDGAHIAATCSKAADDIWSDVLVGKEGKVERLHAVVLRSQTCSPFSTLAAYWKAAASPSGVSCRYWARICSCVAPLAASSSRNSTLKRVPRTHGFPPRICGVETISSSAIGRGSPPCRTVRLR